MLQGNARTLLGTTRPRTALACTQVSVTASSVPWFGECKPKLVQLLFVHERPAAGKGRHSTLQSILHNQRPGGAMLRGAFFASARATAQLTA